METRDALPRHVSDAATGMKDNRNEMMRATRVRMWIEAEGSRFEQLS
jgi:hypothetical protein